jgi:hypothetical protein
MKLVPFNSSWISHDKLDLHAVYRRPRWVADQYGDQVREVDDAGLPTWDVTSGLPVRQHDRWRAKGFEYVTLATRSDLARAMQFGTIPGAATDYEMRDGSPWHYGTYARFAEAERSDDLQQLRADCVRFGADAVEFIRRRSDPNFRLPPSLREAR